MSEAGAVLARMRLVAQLPAEYRNVTNTVTREECAALVDEFERLRNIEKLLLRHASVIHDKAKADVIGPIHGERTGVLIGTHLHFEDWADGHVGLHEAVTAVAERMAWRTREKP